MRFSPDRPAPNLLAKTGYEHFPTLADNENTNTLYYRILTAYLTTYRFLCPREKQPFIYLFIFTSNSLHEYFVYIDEEFHSELTRHVFTKITSNTGIHIIIRYDVQGSDDLMIH